MAKYITDATILIGNTQSNSIFLNETVPTGFIVSGSVITGSLVSFLVSTDNTNFYPLYDNTSTEVSLVVTSASRAYSLSPEAFMGWGFVKFRLGTSASAKAQATYNAELKIITDSM